MKKLTVLVLGLVIMASCSTTKIMTDSVSGADLSVYQTVKIEYQTTEDAPQINPINVDRVQGALKQETQARGLTIAEEADLILVWGVGIDFQRNYSTHSHYHGTGGYGYRRGYGGFSSGSGYSNTTEYVTKNGELQIALIDATTEQVLWVVSATDTIKGKSKKAEEMIDKIVEKVFEDFPMEKLS